MSIAFCLPPTSAGAEQIRQRVDDPVGLGNLLLNRNRIVLHLFEEFDNSLTAIETGFRRRIEIGTELREGGHLAILRQLGGSAIVMESGSITLAGEELDGIGLLYDFKDLKQAMNQIIERLDHQMINDVEPFTVLNPSAENMAKYFYDETNVNLDRVTQGRVRVKNVTVFETDVTTATYSE